MDKLSSRVDQLAQRVGRLSHQLTQETAATKLSRWVSRHPPKSGFVRQIGDGNTGRFVPIPEAWTQFLLLAAWQLLNCSMAACCLLAQRARGDSGAQAWPQPGSQARGLEHT